MVRVDQGGINRLTKTDGGPLMQLLTQIGNRILNNSRGRVNVDTGYLRSTGTLDVNAAESSVRVAYRARYAMWVHNGNGRYRGNPYLLDAFHEEASRL